MVKSNYKRNYKKEGSSLLIQTTEPTFSSSSSPSPLSWSLKSTTKMTNIHLKTRFYIFNNKVAATVAMLICAFEEWPLYSTVLNDVAIRKANAFLKYHTHILPGKIFKASKHKHMSLGHSK